MCSDTVKDDGQVTQNETGRSGDRDVRRQNTACQWTFRHLLYVVVWSCEPSSSEQDSILWLWFLPPYSEKNSLEMNYFFGHQMVSTLLSTPPLQRCVSFCRLLSSSAYSALMHPGSCSRYAIDFVFPLVGRCQAAPEVTRVVALCAVFFLLFLSVWLTCYSFIHSFIIILLGKGFTLKSLSIC